MQIRERPAAALVIAGPLEGEMMECEGDSFRYVERRESSSINYSSSDPVELIPFVEKALLRWRIALGGSDFWFWIPEEWSKEGKQGALIMAWLFERAQKKVEAREQSRRDS